MNQEYWQKQTDTPLFPNLLWSRPETKKGAGKLLIIGGQAQEFIHVAEAYSHAEKSGAGSIRVILPDSTAKITKMLPNIEYAASNSSGSFAKEAINELLDASQWADGVLIAGDLGKNSETNLMLESYMQKYEGMLIISGEAIQSIPQPAGNLFKREDTVSVLDFSALQKMLTEIKFPKPLTSRAGNVELAGILHQLTTELSINIVLVFNKTIWTSRKGRVASTELITPESVSSVAAKTAVWSIQQPNKIFEAITTAVYPA